MSKQHTRDQRYHITYAAQGRILDIAGELRVVVDARLGPLPSIIDRVGGVHMLDPRAVICDDTGRVVYTPRDYPLDAYTTAVRAWLVDHPAWGDSLDGGDAV